MLVVEQNATSRSRSPTEATSSHRAIVLEGKAADLLQNEELRKAYLGR